jgi:hypothetical protein
VSATIGKAFPTIGKVSPTIGKIIPTMVEIDRLWILLLFNKIAIVSDHGRKGFADWFRNRGRPTRFPIIENRKKLLINENWGPGPSPIPFFELPDLPLTPYFPPLTGFFLAEKQKYAKWIRIQY